MVIPARRRLAVTAVVNKAAAMVAVNKAVVMAAVNKAAATAAVNKAVAMAAVNKAVAMVVVIKALPIRVVNRHRATGPKVVGTVKHTAAKPLNRRLRQPLSLQLRPLLDPRHKHNNLHLLQGSVSLAKMVMIRFPSKG